MWLHCEARGRTPEISPHLSKAKFSLSHKMSIMCHTDSSESQSDGFIALRTLWLAFPQPKCFSVSVDKTTYSNHWGSSNVCQHEDTQTHTCKVFVFYKESLAIVCLFTKLMEYVYLFVCVKVHVWCFSGVLASVCMFVHLSVYDAGLYVSVCVRGCSEHCCVCPVGTVKQCACESSQLRGMVQSWVYFYSSYVTHIHTQPCSRTHTQILFTNKNTCLKCVVNVIWSVYMCVCYFLICSC